MPEIYNHATGEYVWVEDEDVEDEDGPFGDEDEDDISDDIPAQPAKPNPPLLIPALDNRPARLVSFEQEIGGDSYAVAQSFYDEGLTSENRVWGYHAGCSEWLHVEDDASVDGEIIYSRLRLNEPRVANRVHSALSVVQRCLSDRLIRLDRRCGFHIHIGIGYDSEAQAGCYSTQSFQSLYHLWNHVEDVVFRLASANWKWHRTEAGNSYASETRKGLDGARLIGRYLRGARHALNMQPFLASRNNCSCGSFEFGEWGSCTCEHLHQPTVEFRVFNATANTQKVRAYVALCQALVAYAATHEVTAATHPPMPWTGTPSLRTDQADERLRFILRTLPLTDGERDDLRYCAERAPEGLPTVVRKIRRRRGHGQAVTS